MEEKGDFVQAEASFQAAIALNPLSGWALQNLGRLQARRGDRARAEVSFRAAIEVAGESGGDGDGKKQDGGAANDAKLDLLLLGKGDLAEAEAILNVLKLKLAQKRGLL